jgi:hypothetical protein
MNENLSEHEKKENLLQKIKDINDNISFFNNKNFNYKSTNIKKEIKNRSNVLRRCFDIKNTVFKEMQSKHNSLIYQELVKNMGKYFFGPNGKVTEKYKFLHDYYQEKDLKMGLSSKISAGTLDYFSLLSNFDSYTQRLNSTKEQLLFSSRNLSVARSGFDIIDQNALSKSKLFNKNKNFVNLNIKNIKNFYRNDIHLTNETNTYKKIIPKIKINFNEENKTSINNINEKNKYLKLRRIKNNILKENQTSLTNELSYKSISPKNSILERYSNESIIKELKQKLNYLDPYYKFSLYSSDNKVNFEEKKKKIKILPEINIKESLKERIKPIVFLNRNSIIDLSFIKKYKINSKNDRNAKRIIMKKNMSNMIYDSKPDFSHSKLPSLENITLSKKKEKLKNKRNFVFEQD